MVSCHQKSNIMTEPTETKTYTLETARCLLRPWQDDDAHELFLYASDPRVGPPAGWAPHKTEEESLSIIRGILAQPYTFAVVLKETGKPVGSVGLMIGKRSHGDLPDKEAEIGYWIGVPYWGQGLIPEAVRRLEQFAFDELGMNILWCGYFDGNEKSHRVQEKCGFTYHHTIPVVELPQLGETRMEHISILRRDEYYGITPRPSILPLLQAAFYILFLIMLFFYYVKG